MVSRLPKWIEFGAFFLALVARCVNAIGLLGFEHQAVSHVSGTATLLGTRFFSHSLTEVVHLAGILISFFAGACISGYLLHGTTLQLGKHYDTALLLESCLLFTALYLLSRGSFYGHYAASVSCGLQNALATTYSGAIIRTTHLTGIFTDLGIMIGEFLRGEQFDKRKAVLFLLLISGFIAGGAVGAWLFQRFKFNALLFPGIACLILAFIYYLYRMHQTRTARNR